MLAVVAVVVKKVGFTCTHTSTPWVPRSKVVGQEGGGMEEAKTKNGDQGPTSHLYRFECTTDVYACMWGKL